MVAERRKAIEKMMKKLYISINHPY